MELLSLPRIERASFLPAPDRGTQCVSGRAAIGCTSKKPQLAPDWQNNKHLFISTTATGKNPL
jgi:hypothetical protein